MQSCRAHNTVSFLFCLEQQWEEMGWKGRKITLLSIDTHTSALSFPHLSLSNEFMVLKTMYMWELLHGFRDFDHDTTKASLLQFLLLRPVSRTSSQNFKLIYCSTVTHLQYCASYTNCYFIQCSVFASTEQIFGTATVRSRLTSTGFVRSRFNPLLSSHTLFTVRFKYFPV